MEKACIQLELNGLDFTCRIYYYHKVCKISCGCELVTVGAFIQIKKHHFDKLYLNKSGVSVVDIESKILRYVCL